MSRALVSLICIFALNARADWTGWHGSAWTNYRSVTETVTVFATAHSYVLTNYFGTNSPVVTNAFLSNIYAASNSTTFVFTVSFSCVNSTGVVFTDSRVTTNRHGSTNLILANREIVCYDLYKAMRERDSALCAAESTKESVRFYRYERDNLTYAKAWVAGRLGNFISTNQPADGFAPWTTKSLLTACGLPTNYLKQTPYRALWCGDAAGRMVETSSWTLATRTNIVTNLLTTTCGNVITNIGTGGVVTAICTNAFPYEGINSDGSTWGFCGIKAIFNQLQWTAAYGAPADCGIVTNWNAYKSGAFCNVPTLESNYVFVATNGPFPLYESRHWNTGTNVTYQYKWEETFTDYIQCLGPNPSSTITSTVSSCSVMVNTTNGGPTSTNCGERYTIQVDIYILTNTITVADACNLGYICAIPDSCLSSHLSPIIFDNCTNRYGTNVTFSGFIYYNVGSTGTCAGAATLTDPFGYGLTEGWNNSFLVASNLFTNTTICTTNFSPANRVPWTGDTATNPLAWVIYDARLVKKWNFAHKP